MRTLAATVVIVLVTAFAASIGLVSRPTRAGAAGLPLRTTYVANAFANSITEYASGATGNTAPVATITGPHTGLDVPAGLTVDLSGRLYVANAFGGTVTEYAAGASGDASPVATLTGIASPRAVTVDKAGRLYVSDPASNAIFVFAPGANEATPVAKITGPHTGLDLPSGIVVDGSGRLDVSNAGLSTSSVTEYAPGANGDAAPVATIAGANTHLVGPVGLALDASNRLWVSNAGTPTVTVYASAVSGNVAPVATITGPATKLPGSGGLAVDTAGHVHVTGGGDNVVEYTGTANGNVAPVGQLVGAATGLRAAEAVAIAGPLFVATSSLPSGTIGGPYSATVAGALGTPPYTFSIAFGNLPPGLTLNATTGVISGRPSAGGVASFAVVLRDAATPKANVAARVLSIAVGPPQIYVADAQSGAIDEFARNASGNATPVNVLGVPGTAARDLIAVDGSGNLVVADQSADTLTVYGPGTTGNGRPALTLDAIASGLNEPGGITTDARDRVYVSNVLGKSVTRFTFTPNGGGTSVQTLIGAHTGLAAPSGVAIDASGRLHVGATAGTVTTYAAGATGDSAPVSTLAGSKTGIDFASSLAFDGSGRLYVLSTSQAGSSIRVFAANASGNVAPVAVITGASTQLLNPTALAVDTTGRVFVSNGGSALGATPGAVLEFAPGANGNVAPATTIAGATTGIVSPSGIAVTPPLFLAGPSLPHARLGQSYTAPLAALLGTPPYSFAVTGGALPQGIVLKNGVLSGRPTATGTATFTVTVTDGAQPADTASRSYTITTDVQPLVYVANIGNDTVTAYPPGSNGNITPTLTLGGAATGLSGPAGLAFDDLGTLYVADSTAPPAGSVTVYAPGVSGNAAPIRTIAGSKTGIVGPKAVALDGNGRLYVASSLAGHVTVYAPNAAGNVAPVATVAGLGNPDAIAFDPSGRLYVNDGDVVKIFPANVTGTVTTPVATLGGAGTGLGGVAGLVFDSTGRLHASNLNAQTLTTYAAGSTGNAAPAQTVTGVVNPFAVDVDTLDHLYVARDAGTVWAVDTYTSSGLKFGSITGPATGLNRPEGVAATPPLAVQTSALPVGTVGRRYFAQLQAALGTTPYVWTLGRGSLPPGLALSTTGALSGTPTRAGDFQVTFVVTDASAPHQTDGVALTLRVRRR